MEETCTIVRARVRLRIGIMNIAHNWSLNCGGGTPGNGSTMWGGGGGGFIALYLNTLLLMVESMGLTHIVI